MFPLLDVPADRYYGVRQFWSSVTDFGFSKTPEETLRAITSTGVVRNFPKNTVLITGYQALLLVVAALTRLMPGRQRAG